MSNLSFVYSMLRQCDSTPALNISDLILNDTKLNRTIIEGFALIDIVRPLIDIKANNPSVSGDVLDSFLNLILKILSNFSVDTSYIPRTFAGIVSLIQPLIPSSLRVPVCKSCGQEASGVLDTKCTKCDLDLFDNLGNPLKQQHIIPLIPRLRQLMQIKPIARMLKNSANLKPLSNFSALSQCPMQSNSNSLTLRLLFSTDGGCPWHSHNRTYSVWPGTVDVLNFTHSLRRDLMFTLLVFLSEGPHKPVDMNTLLAYFSRELGILEHGIEVFDADSNAMITLKVKLEIICADGPAFSALHHIPHATAKKDACSRCTVAGVREPVLKKQIFTTDKIEMRSKMDYDIVRVLLISRASDRLNQYVSQFGKNGVEKFAELSYFDGSSYAIDPMHLFRNIIVRIYSIISRFSEPNVLQAEIESGRFDTSNEYSLSKDGLKLANERFSRIVIPTHLFDRPGELFSKKFPNLKSHTWIRLLTSGVLSYCTRDLLPQKQWDAVWELTSMIRVIMSHNISPNTDFKLLEIDVLKCVKNIQDSFPLALRTLQLHLICHFPRQLQQFGPAASYWMFNSERYMSWVMQRLKLNKAHAESTAINCYALRWAATLLTAICDPAELFTPPTTSLHTTRTTKMSPSELGAIAAAWNFVNKNNRNAQFKTPGQVDTHTGYYESCKLHSITMLKRSDYAYISYDNQDIAVKVLFFCSVNFCDSEHNFALFQKMDQISTASDCPMYHVDQFDVCNLCVPLSTLVVSKPLVYIQEGVGCVTLLGERDYLFPDTVAYA